MYNAVIFHKETGEVFRHFKTLRGAKMSLTRWQKKAKATLNAFEARNNFTFYDWTVTEADKLVADTIEGFMASDAYAYSQEMVPVVNTISGNGKTVMIKRCQVSGPCDPSTELYHCS